MNHKTVSWIIVLLFLVTPCILGNPGQGKPNVVIIYGDDLGIGDLSCYGSYHIKTPNIDKLAREGIIFHDAHSPNAFCSASRYSLLTGRYSWRSAVPHHRDGTFLRPGAPFSIHPGRFTLADLFNSAGYKTACIGKWHLGIGNKSKEEKEWNDSLRPCPNDAGFDYFFGLPGSNNYSPHIYMKNNMVVGNRKERDIARVLTGEAVNFISENRDQPFLLYFPTTNIHVPWTPNAEHLGKSKIGDYGDFVAEFDWIVGQISLVLKETGIFENTLIIVTSDNGAWAADDTYYNGKREPSNLNFHFRAIRDAGHFSNLYYQGNKGRLFEGGHRVPFVISWPASISQPGSNYSFISQMDLMASFGMLLNVDIPEGMAEDSQSMLSFLTGEQTSGMIREEYVLVAKAKFSYRNRDWVYIDGPTNGTEDMERGPVQLYNLRTDPSQRQNLALEYPEMAEKMKLRLHELLEEENTMAR
jgi:arylsulfatase A-like enzyme